MFPLRQLFAFGKVKIEDIHEHALFEKEQRV